MRKIFLLKARVRASIIKRQPSTPYQSTVGLLVLSEEANDCRFMAFLSRTSQVPEGDKAPVFRVIREWHEKGMFKGLDAFVNTSTGAGTAGDTHAPVSGTPLSHHHHHHHHQDTYNVDEGGGYRKKSGHRNGEASDGAPGSISSYPPAYEHGDSGRTGESWSGGGLGDGLDEPLSDSRFVPKEPPLPPENDPFGTGVGDDGAGNDDGESGQEQEEPPPPPPPPGPPPSARSALDLAMNGGSVLEQHKLYLREQERLQQQQALLQEQALHHQEDSDVPPPPPPPTSTSTMVTALADEGDDIEPDEEEEEEEEPPPPPPPPAENNNNSEGKIMELWSLLHEANTSSAAAATTDTSTRATVDITSAGAPGDPKFAPAGSMASGRTAGDHNIAAAGQPPPPPPQDGSSMMMSERHRQQQRGPNGGGDPTNGAGGGDGFHLPPPPPPPERNNPLGGMGNPTLPLPDGQNADDGPRYDPFSAPMRGPQGPGQGGPPHMMHQHGGIPGGGPIGMGMGPGMGPGIGPGGMEMGGAPMMRQGDMGDPGMGQGGSVMGGPRGLPQSMFFQGMPQLGET